MDPLSIPVGQNWIFALRASVSEIGSDFQNYHIRSWNLEFGKVLEVAYEPSFYTKGSKLGLFLLYVQWFPRCWSLFKSHIWAWNLEFEISARSSLVSRCGRNWTYVRSTDSGFRDTGRIQKLPYLGMKPGIWKTCRKLLILYEVSYFSFYPRGSKLGLFSLYGQRFPRHGLAFKIAIFGHETWSLNKRCIWTIFLPHGGRNWAYFRFTGSGFRYMDWFSKLPYLMYICGL